MPRRPVVRTPYGPRPHLTVPVPVDPDGHRGPTPGQARGPSWRRVATGLFVPSEVEEVPQQRVLEASCRLPAYGGVTGWATLAWHGGRWFDGLGRGGSVLPVPLAVGPHDVRPCDAIEVSKERLAPEECESVDGLRTTTPVRAVLFAARHAPDLASAVTTIDMACFDDLVSLAELEVALVQHRTFTGVPQARAAVALAEENAWSPAEVDQRLVWRLLAGLPPVRCNVPVFTLDGRHVGTPDLLDEQAGLAIEHDGAAHLTSRRRAVDVRRERAFRDVGLDTLTLVGADLYDRHGTARRMAHARRAAPWTPPGERRWTTVPPRWWVPTDTVARRRALSAEQAGRLLSYRRAG